ncbi:MAG TPA: VWA domain-containing protein, partial [Anaerohalosphaeraceae bacterium]|nr:VWA domain-containing protein [Anaerohalosphaeraceae bacterium]
MDLSTIDALFIADADQDILTGRHIDRIRQAVDAGMGLMVFPGPQLVADRLLAEGPLAELLPVSLYQDGKKTNPDTTVVFIVDTSGSMTGSRIAVAREIARRAISRLAPYDKAGIVEFYGNRRWAAPIQSAANQLDLYRALNRLTAGGGTVIIPAMEEAYYALLNVNSTTRHIVVISDGGVENANYEALLRKIADSRISVSTILVGPATHTGFMAELSQWGQGGFFHAEERFILPDMNFKTVLDKTGSPYRHTTEPLAARYPSTVLSGISIDKLVGSWDYLPAQIKKGGQAVVEFSSGQPMISLWNYSLGQVAFWSVDLFHQQTADTDISRMVANAARKIYRTQNQDIAVQVRQNNNRFDVQVQNNNRIPSDSAVPQTLVLYSDENEKLRLPLSFRDGRTAHISIHDLPEGFYHIDIEKSPDQIIAQSGFSANPVPEIKAYQSDHQLIDRLSGLSGRHAVSQSAEAPAGTLELWPYCIGFSMILFLLHILIRRLPLSLRKSLAVWVGFLLISSSATFAAVETENTNISSVNPSPRNIYVRMDPNSHRPLFPDMVSMLGSESANLKTVAVLCGDFASARTLGASSQIPDFSDGMLTGFYLYKLTEYAQAYDAFQQASQLAKTDNDRKYALAWALRMAEKSDKRDRFETRLLASEPFLKHHCRILELLYGLNSDLNGLKRLYEKIESLPAFNEADKVRLEQQIIDMSVDRSNDQTAVSLQSGQKGKTNVAFMLGQVRACLIQGDRIQAAQMLEAMLSNPELSENWLFIAQNAAGMAFYDIADTAADRVMKQVDSQRYAAGIFRVTLMLSRGNQAGAIEMLDTLQNTVKLNERQDYEIAQYYEKLGQYTRAIEQYRQIYLRTQAVDVQMRVAWLHEKNGNFEQAYQAWLTLWKDCRQPALLYQIQPRLLEVASRTGQLASLAIELEESLEKNGPDTRILELLVDLYVSVGDSIAAVELVRQYCGDMDVKSLEWQYRIYLRCREYGRCRRVLFRLIEKDPLHSGDYYRQLALLAVEKGDEKDALSVVKSIQSSRQVNTIDLEYTAGIWDLLERPELAMEAYGQLLRQESPAAETWLLWSNAAAKAGRKEEAISTLSTLLADEVSDDLFTVAVDALLNLKADATRLENALVHIYARIAQAPDKVFFYRLAVDVLSEIAGGGDYAEFLFPAAIYAPDGRVALLQEIQRAAASKQTDELLDYGIVLVYMDTQLPPHAGIELGKSFLERGEYKTAHFLFHRTPYLFEDSGLCLGIADAYDRIGAFNEAELLVREALAVAPDNPQLLIRSASYHEIKGNYEDAWQEYFRLYQLTLNSLSAPHENSGNGQKTPVKNTQAEDRYFQIALHGLLSTMAADKQAADTLHYFETSLDTLKQQDLKSDPIAYARLVRLWKDYEQICLAREDMTRLNKHVEPLVQKVLDKPELLTEMIQNRLAGGDIKSAFDIAGKIDKKLWPRQLQWLSPDSLDTSDLSALTDEVVYQALMKAILSNNDEQAQRWMEEILSRKPGLPDDQLQSVELTSALLLGKPELLRRVISKQVTALSAAPSAKRYIAANRLIDAVWPILSETDRKGLLSQIAAANAADADIQHLVDMTLIRSHYKSYYPPERAYRYAEDGEKQVVRLAEILSYSEPNQRTGIVQRAVTSLPAARRCMFLLELVGQIRYSISDQEQSEYIALFKASLPLKLAAQSQYTTLSRYTGKNRSSCLLVQSFAEILLSQMPDNIAVNAFAVKSRFNAGQMREAKALARNVIDTLTEAVDINYEFKAILTDAVRALSHEDISEVLSDYMLTLDITGPSLPLYFITAVLNETLGDHQQARTQI